MEFIKRQSAHINRERFDNYRRLLSYLAPYKFYMVVTIIALLISTALGLILPLVIRNLVDIVFATKDLAQLNQLAILLLVVFLVQAFFSFIHQISISYVGEKTVAEIRLQLYQHLQTLSLQFYADHRTGEIVSRITSDVAQIQHAITTNLVSLLRQAVTLLGASILLFILDWRLTAIILAGIPIISLTMVMLGRKIRAAAKEAQDALAQAANVVEETTSGIQIVKSFVREAHETGRFATQIERTFQAAMHQAKIRSILSPTIGFMAFFSISITLWFGSYEVINGQLTAGELVAYLVYTMMVATPVANLASLYAQIQAALGSTERIFELLDTAPDIQSPENPIAIENFAGGISFQDVHFSYMPTTPILRGVTFTAQPGQLIALVGPSGAGKSSLVNLIPRFYDINEGSIQIDGIDTRQLDLHELRQHIGSVPQDPLLFSDTVRANIQYGRLDASEAEIEAAAVAANAHHFIINELPNGYETIVGERGVKLSGGQRQRVAIARAVLKDPRILILDEATSSLDSESEALVQDALEKLMVGRTSFVIAHRLSTVVKADIILVLDTGKIVESGTHQQLIEQPESLYRRWYEMQSTPISTEFK